MFISISLIDSHLRREGLNVKVIFAIQYGNSNRQFLYDQLLGCRANSPRLFSPMFWGVVAENQQHHWMNLHFATKVRAGSIRGNQRASLKEWQPCNDRRQKWLPPFLSPPESGVRDLGFRSEGRHFKSWVLLRSQCPELLSL